MPVARPHERPRLSISISLSRIWHILLICSFVAAFSYLSYCSDFTVFNSHATFNWGLTVSTIDYTIGNDCIKLLLYGASCSCLFNYLSALSFLRYGTLSCCPVLHILTRLPSPEWQQAPLLPFQALSP